MLEYNTGDYRLDKLTLSKQSNELILHNIN
jgi:hypothetical protein